MKIHTHTHTYTKTQWHNYHHVHFVHHWLLNTLVTQTTITLGTPCTLCTLFAKKKNESYLLSKSLHHYHNVHFVHLTSLHFGHSDHHYTKNTLYTLYTFCKKEKWILLAQEIITHRVLVDLLTPKKYAIAKTHIFEQLMGRVITPQNLKMLTGRYP